MILARRRFFGLLTAAVLGGSRGGRAEPLPAPTGSVILTVSGRIKVCNRGDKAVFDRAMLETLGSSSIRTQTPWYNGSQLFEGVPMQMLMQRVGAFGQKVIVTAINDYLTEIPVDDFAHYQVILAMRRNGKDMPVSDKGPLFIVYPYDSGLALQTQTFYSRSAWQVMALQVV